MTKILSKTLPLDELQDFLDKLPTEGQEYAEIKTMSVHENMVTLIWIE